MNSKTTSGGVSASSLTVKTFNVNGLGNYSKRAQIFKFMEKKGADIYFIIDTRFSKDIENRVKEEWGSNVFFSSFSSQSRGVAIFFKKQLCAEVLNQQNDVSGNMLSLLVNFDSKNILFTALYGPNVDDPEFYKNKVFNLIDEWEPDFAVHGGDWNMVLNQNLDTKNYLHENNKNAKNEVKSKMEYFSLIDVWRELNPTLKTFTWTGKSTKPAKLARLDFFLVSNSLLPFIKNAKIEPGILSDHSVSSIEIDFSNFQRGRGFWKFNNSLLKDPQYVSRVKNCIKKVIKIYAPEDISMDVIDDANPEQLQHFSSSINPQLLFDMVQLEIRGETIKYSAAKKKKKNATMQLLLHRLEELEAQSGSDTVDVADLLKTTRTELEALFRHEAEGAAIRARAHYKLNGEKATRLFCSLEKYNGTQKFIPQLIIEESGKSRTITEQSEIQNETKKFYTKLYSNHDQFINQNIESFLGASAQTFPKLKPSDTDHMEGHLTVGEMTGYLKETKNNAAPGSSGFTNDFYKFFWIDLKHFVVNSANYSFDIGTLSIQQRLGIITLLPKGSKDKRYLSNWRPLTLLNNFYSLVSGWCQVPG